MKAFCPAIIYPNRKTEFCLRTPSHTLDSSPSFLEVLKLASEEHPKAMKLLEHFPRNGGPKDLRAAITLYGKKGTDVRICMIFSYIIWLEQNNFAYATAGATDLFDELNDYLDGQVPSAPGCSFLNIPARARLAAWGASGIFD